jgi:Fur family transcriptional regulator, peroxide stress response regulator
VSVSRQELERRLACFEDAARNAGIRLTHQRLEIFRAVASSIEHPAAEAIFRAVQERIPTVSLDTVYRTLWTLEDLGIVATLGPRRGTARFDANLRPHHHFTCVRCGLTRDFEDSALDALPVPAAAKRYGEVVGARVELRGVCQRCSAGERPRAPGAARIAAREGRRVPDERSS